MPENPPAQYPTVTPYLLYEDVPAALEWLSKAFGFRERLRFTAEDGTVNHAEMQLADGATILSPPEDQPYGDRSYNAEDPEGHRWSFLQHVRDVTPADWGATTA